MLIAFGRVCEGRKLRVSATESKIIVGGRKV